MNTVTVTADTLVVEPHGTDRVWSQPRRLEIPLHRVLGAIIDPGVMTEHKGMRTAGLMFRGKHSGTFMRSGERSFWNVSPDAVDRIVVVALVDDHYSRLVISVEHPQQLVRQINSVLIG